MTPNTIFDPVPPLPSPNSHAHSSPQTSPSARPDPPSSSDPSQPRRPVPKRTASTDIAFADPEVLSRAHANLDERLRPFWASVLPSRRLAISIFSADISQKPHQTGPKLAESGEPLFQTTFSTNQQGHFSHNIVIPWERLCTHGPSLPVVFEERPDQVGNHWGIAIRAELLIDITPSPSAVSAGSPVTRASAVRPERGTRPAKANVNALSSRIPSESADDSPNQTLYDEPEPFSTDDPIESVTSAFSRFDLRPSGTENTLQVKVSDSGGLRVLSDLVSAVSSQTGVFL